MPQSLSLNLEHLVSSTKDRMLLQSDKLPAPHKETKIKAGQETGGHRQGCRG
jgi:hypothetical protein